MIPDIKLHMVQESQVFQVEHILINGMQHYYEVKTSSSNDISAYRTTPPDWCSQAMPTLESNGKINRRERITRQPHHHSPLHSLQRSYRAGHKVAYHQSADTCMFHPRHLSITPTWAGSLHQQFQQLPTYRHSTGCSSLGLCKSFDRQSMLPSHRRGSHQRFNHSCSQRHQNWVQLLP